MSEMRITDVSRSIPITVSDVKSGMILRYDTTMVTVSNVNDCHGDHCPRGQSPCVELTIMSTPIDLGTCHHHPDDRVVQVTDLVGYQRQISELQHALETARQREMSYRARLHVDPVTGVRSRSWLYDVWEDRSNSTPRSLMMIDINEFKTVNDTYGHDIGDLVLATVASRLTAMPGDTVRLAGDEFVIINWKSIMDDNTIAAVRDLVSQPIRIPCENSLRIDIAAGVVAIPTNSTLQDILHQADMLMYQHKRQNRIRSRRRIRG